jgi:hypothetical protein
MKKALATLLLPLTLVGCGDSLDFVYNDRVSSTLQDSMKQFDSDHQNFLQGKFDISSQSTRDLRLEQLRKHIADLELALDQVEKLRHSENADRFSRYLSGYYELQVGYYQNLRRYMRATDRTKKSGLAEELQASYVLLSAAPERIFNSQKKFMEKSGLPAEPAPFAKGG